MDSFADIQVVRVRDGRREQARDRAAAEEPLEVRLLGRPFAVIMRTPGADRELAAGFLFAERVIREADDLGAILHCRDADAQNVVDVTLVGAAADRLEQVMADRRNVVANSSCGLCGRVAIESLGVEAAPLAGAGKAAITPSTIAALPERLRAAQPLFEATGGLHAAGLFDASGTLITSAEDVGRHNAVDKVVGRMLLGDALPLRDHALFVSGRTSFEIVQKAWLAGIPVLASVSAPSSLAIHLAESAGITLVGFVRGNGFNIYSHAERVRT